MQLYSYEPGFRPPSESVNESPGFILRLLESSAMRSVPKFASSCAFESAGTFAGSNATLCGPPFSTTNLMPSPTFAVMFADSVGLIEERGFLRFLEAYRGKADRFHEGARVFFGLMDQGGHCLAIQQRLRRFNGGLFRSAVPLPITEEELEALIAAARCDWALVEPAIFGALLEQALDPQERAELGAHYTPRAYVERLIEPTIMEDQAQLGIKP